MKWILLLPITLCAASAGDLSGIREHYGEVKEMIENGEQLYRTDLEINSNGLMYPALGSYGRSFQFYWDLDEENYPSSRLLFISVNSQYAAVEEYEEFLFDRSGELEFYFSSGGYEMEEKRYYFDGGALFRYSINGESSNHPDDEAAAEGERILIESERLFEAFGLTH